MKIVHISDLHISGINFVPDWGEKVINFINSISPEILVITGDVTDEGYVDEYEKAKQYIERLKCTNLLIVPGNHDARNNGYEIFEEMFQSRYPVYNGKDIIIMGMDSSEPDIDDGHIGREHYRSIKETLGNEGKKITILAMHHHLIPIPDTGRERHIPVDAGDVLKVCVDQNVNFVYPAISIVHGYGS